MAEHASACLTHGDAILFPGLQHHGQSCWLLLACQGRAKLRFPPGDAAALAAEVTLLLLALAQVVAGSPFAGSELQAAALLLMLSLHGKIHRAVGAMWAAEIPLLLQCLKGKVLVGREGRRQGRGGE